MRADPTIIGAVGLDLSAGGLLPEVGRTIDYCAGADLPPCPQGGSTEGTRTPHCQRQCSLLLDPARVPLPSSSIDFGARDFQFKVRACEIERRNCPCTARNAAGRIDHFGARDSQSKVMRTLAEIEISSGTAWLPRSRLPEVASSSSHAPPLPLPPPPLRSRPPPPHPPPLPLPPPPLPASSLLLLPPQAGGQVGFKQGAK